MPNGSLEPGCNSLFVLFFSSVIFCSFFFFPPLQNPAEPGSSVALTNGGDWVTTAAIDAAQSFLASAVSAAANSRPWPPPESPSSPSRTHAWPVSARRPVRPPGPTSPAQLPPLPPLPPNMQHGGPPGLATMMAAAQAAGAPPAFEIVVGGVQVVAPPAAGTAAAAAAGAGAPAAAAPAAGGGVPATALFTADSVLGVGRKSVLIHYEGYKSRYDEWITVQSPRLAPFRSRTSRPLSVTMQSVERVVNGASVRCVGHGGSGRRRVLAGGGVVRVRTKGVLFSRCTPPPLPPPLAWCARAVRSLTARSYVDALTP